MACWASSSGSISAPPSGVVRTLIRQMRAVAFHLARARIVQQRAHGGGADVEAYNEGIRPASVSNRHLCSIGCSRRFPVITCCAPATAWSRRCRAARIRCSCCMRCWKSRRAGRDGGRRGAFESQTARRGVGGGRAVRGGAGRAATASPFIAKRRGWRSRRQSGTGRSPRSTEVLFRADSAKGRPIASPPGHTRDDQAETVLFRHAARLGTDRAWREFCR